MYLEECYQKILLEDFCPVVLPFFETIGPVDVGKWPQNNPIERLLSIELALMDDQDTSTFCCDGIVPVQIVVKKNLIKFWGHIWWLNAPENHPRNRSGKDPFYAEISKKGRQISIPLMLFGDYAKLPIDKYYWPEMSIEWIFEITR